jgi:cbb3-type cytochrome oxidase maturation protein
MNSIYLLIPLSILLIGLGIWAFFWAVNSGQFDDMEEPARSILDDDAAPRRDP